MVNEDWKIKAISEVCEVNPSRTEVQSLSDQLDVSFVPMSAVSEDGKLTEIRIRKARNVKKGFPHFRENDVLLAKITPSFENGKRWLATGLVNGVGFGSTEFHVIRANDEILPEWIYYFISTPRFKEDGANRMTGTAGQKRISSSFLENYAIPVPSIQVQKKLVGVLHHAEELRETRQQANQLTSSIVMSVFLKMFGDPAKNFKNFPSQSFGSLIAETRNGFGRRRKAGESGGPIVLRIQDIQKGEIDFHDLNRIPMASSELEQYRLLPGDILFVRVNGNIDLVGKVALFEESDGIAFNDHIVRIRANLNIIRPVFLKFFLETNYAREEIRRLCVTSAGQFSVGQQRLAGVVVPVPRLSLQCEFETVVAKCKSVLASQGKSTEDINKLVHSLMHKAFNGELTTSVGFS